MTVEDLKSIISAMTSVPAATLNLYHNGDALSDSSRSLGSYDLKNDDMIIMVSRPSVAANRTRPADTPQFQPGNQQQTPHQVRQYDREMIRQHVLNDPAILENLRQSNPELASAVNDPARFYREYAEFERRKQEAEAAKQREIAMLNEDPFNIEAQQKIEELIRQEQVMENLQNALEHHPEGRVLCARQKARVNWG